jgi:hypothetical protein
VGPRLHAPGTARLVVVQRLVRAWAQLHAEELIADWELAANERPLKAIDPLR